MKKKFQVFISSTYLDLIEERQAAVEAILSAGHIPAGMELFTAGNESQWEVIKRWIEESDMYMLILGGRYGSIEPKSNKSYTQLEYEYALSIDKPLFTVVISKEALNEKAKNLGVDAIETSLPLYKEFNNHVTNKMVKFWDNKKDIKLAIYESINQFVSTKKMIGWVRGNESLDNIVVTDEIVRLSKENAEMREKLIDYDNSNKILGLSFDEFFKIILNEEIVDSLTTQELTNTYYEKISKYFSIDYKSLLSYFIVKNKFFIGRKPYSASIVKKLDDYNLIILTEPGTIRNDITTCTVTLSEHGKMFLLYLKKRLPPDIFP